MISKGDIILHTARRLDRNPQTVGRYVNCFLEELRAALIHGGEVSISGLGRFKVQEVPGHNTANLPGTGEVADTVHIRVSFKKSSTLREELKRKKR